MKAFLGKQKLKEKAIALSNSAKSLLKFLRVRKFRLHGHASQGLMVEFTSSIPLLAAAWWPPGSLATSPAPRTWSSPCTRSSGSPGRKSERKWCLFKKVGKLVYLMLAWHVSLLLEQDSSVPATRVSFNVVQVAGLQKSDLVFARGRRGSDNRSYMIFFKKITPPYFGFWFYAQKRY